jgi:hypothetical protein
VTSHHFDRAVISANEHWLYLDFWPLVAYAYRTVFPDVRVTLAFLSERLEYDPFVAQLRAHGEVVLVRPVRDIPQAAQAKMARYFVASTMRDSVCMIDDIDEIPIDRDWHVGKLAQRRPEALLMVGAEVYGRDANQCPASMMTATGWTFRRLFNPTDRPFAEWIRTMSRPARRHADIYSPSHHEGMDCTTAQDYLGTPLFSDEALIGELLRECPDVPVQHVERGYQPGVDTIDRSWWNALDMAKLEAGGYLAAHTGRPYLECKAGNDAIVDYLRRRYGGGPLPEPLARRPQVDADMRFDDGMTRATFEELCSTLPLGALVMEVGSGHVTTNYLSRYFWLISVEDRRNMLNIYPSHYIYAPGFDEAIIREGMMHRRIQQREPVQMWLDYRKQ